MTETLPKLNYLDDRPIYDHERVVADAFVKGGEEEVKRVKEEMQNKRLDQKKRTYEEHTKKMEEGRKRRKDQLKAMLGELRVEKSEMVEKREQLKAEYKAMPSNDSEKNRTLAKIKKIDVDL